MSNSKTALKYTIAFLLGSILLLFTAFFSFSDDRLHVVFCNVGQGDAILVYQKNVQVLIDGGPDNSVVSCLSSHMPFWDRKIELVILTHTETDHFVGFVDVLRRYQVEKFATSGIGKSAKGVQALSEEIQKRKIPVAFVTLGKRINIDQLSFSVFWPAKEYLAQKSGFLGESNVLGASTSENTSLNELSVVLGVSYGDFDALLTGDIVPPATDLVRVKNGDWEVLKVPHHGSKNGLTQRFLEKVKPELAVISTGKDNRYGHPHKEILEMLEHLKIKVFRTDYDGEVEIVTDGTKWRLEH